MRRGTCIVHAAVFAACAAAGPAFAQEETGVRDEMERLRRAMEEMQRRHDAEMAALRARLDGREAPEPSDLLREIDRLTDRMDEMELGIGSIRTAPPSVRLIDVSLNALIAAGTSTEDEETIGVLQGGGHDPKNRGFTAQNVELILKGAVDPYFVAQANLVTSIDPDGETITELEEAFAATTSLPWGLQAKAGQFFTEFGRHNPEHPHQWEFVDAPVVNTRFFGPDGMRGVGARLSWLAPTAFPVEFAATLQNARGETMTSFLGVVEEGGEEEGHGHGGGETVVGELRERRVRTIDDMVRTFRATASFDVSDATTLLFGGSGAFGPNASGDTTTTRILGADVTAKWRPLDADHGFPFVEFRGEYLARRFEFEGFEDEAGDVFGTGTIRDHGTHAHLIWGFARGWTLGVRHERVRGDFEEMIFGLEDRTRWSFGLTHYFSEYAKVRLQINRDRSEALSGGATTVWLQLEFNLGAHGAHKF